MFLNDKKGWYGSFSTTGKGAAMKYLVIKGDNKTMRKSQSAKDFCSSILKKRDLNKEVDIFSVEDFEAFLREKNKNNKRSEKDNKYYYYNRHRKNPVFKEKQYGPSCTQYNPKYSLILTRSVSLPGWKTVTGRKNFIKKDEGKFYLSQESIISHPAGKSFIDMSKQLDRPDSTKKTRPNSCVNVSKEKDISSNISFRNKGKSNRTSSSLQQLSPSLRRAESAKKSINENCTTQSLEDSYEEFKPQYMKQLNPKKHIKKSKKKNAKKSIIKAPNFKTMISREHLDSIQDKQGSLVPFSLPNFKQVRERPIMMVVYDQVRYKKLKKSEFKGVDLGFNYDPNKVLDKVNNHTKIHPPNFNLMTSRPCDEGPLPGYMKKNFSRSSCYEFSELSLKMNNYSNSTFLDPSTSFWPKVSFNKVINLNLLKSSKLMSDSIGKTKLGNTVTGRALKFYHKNFKDLLKDEILNKFDGITLKSNRRSNSLDIKNVEKYLLNYST